MTDIAICAIGQFEEDYLEEWFDHHFNIGFDKIYFYDNNPVNNNLQKNICDKYQNVVYFDWRGNNNRRIQWNAYNETFNKFKNTFKYIAFIDIDEFIVFNPDQPIQNIKDFLNKNKRNYYHLSWMIMDDNNLVFKDKRPVMERFTHPCNKMNNKVNGKNNRNLKHIIASCVKDPKIDIHFSYCKEKCYNCSDKIVDGNSMFMEPDHSVCYIKHFYTKTVEEYMNTKAKRISCAGRRPQYKQGEFFIYNEKTEKKEMLFNNIMPNTYIETINNFIKYRDYNSYYQINSDETIKEILCKTYLSEKDIIPDMKFDCIYINGLNYQNSNELFKDITSAKELINENGIIFINGNKQDLVKFSIAAELENYIFYKINNIYAIDYFKNEMINCVEQGVQQGVEQSSNSVEQSSNTVEQSSSNVWEIVEQLSSNVQHIVEQGVGEIVDQSSSNVQHIVEQGVGEIVEQGVGEIVEQSLNTEIIYKINNTYELTVNKKLQRYLDMISEIYDISDISVNKLIYIYDPKEYNNWFIDEAYEIVNKPICICTIAKNEEEYLDEWIQHHLKIGFDKIHFYDNNDPKNNKQYNVLKKYIDEGIVIYNDVRGKIKYQVPAYNDFYSKFGNKIYYAAMIDIDEFIVFNPNQPIQDIKTFFRKTNKNYYHLSWKMYGDNNLVYKDSRPVMERFTNPLPDNICIQYNFPENRHVKSIIKGGLNNITFTHCHLVTCKEKCYRPDLHRVNGDNPFMDPDHSICYIKHFYTKTAEEWKEKMKRRTATTNKAKYNTEIFFKINTKTKEKEMVFKK
jgi:hypothetical protein